MKKRITILSIFAILISTAIASTVSKKSVLTIRFNESSNYMVVLDDVKFSAQNIFQINGISPGVKQLRIVKQTFNPYVNDVNKTIIYNDFITIHPGTKTTATLRSNGAFEINSVSPIHEIDETHGNVNDETLIVNNHMSRNQLAELKDLANATYYSRGKLNVMKQAIQLYGISSSQIKELMYHLPEERHKLELAKYAYAFTDDKQNYYQVRASLDKDYSKEMLTAHISKDKEPTI